MDACQGGGRSRERVRNVNAVHGLRIKRLPVGIDFAAAAQFDVSVREQHVGRSIVTDLDRIGCVDVRPFHPSLITNTEEGFFSCLPLFSRMPKILEME